MIRIAAIVLVCLAAVAQARSQSALVEGSWTGSLTPMNHPDIHTALVYDVSHLDDRVHIALGIPDGESVPVRELNLEADTLRFVFNEPEEDVLLACTLGGDGSGGYEGRCSDAVGKWAFFTMSPPEE